MTVPVVAVTRILRWRAAVVIAGALYLLGWLYASGITRAVIQVDFQQAPFLEGAQVVIDGDSAGVLVRHGRRLLTGFRVKTGEHTVEVPAEGYASEPVSVNAELRGTQYLLYAYTDGRRTEQGWERVLALSRTMPD